ncbi:MAG TPA: response regulator [Nitrospiraceae bacterium]
MPMILVATPKQHLGDIIGDRLRADTHEVTLARTGAAALQSFETVPPAAIVMDIELSGPSALAVLAKIRARAPRTPVVVLANEVSIEAENQAREMGAFDVIQQKLKLNVLMQVINRALQQSVMAGVSVSDAGKAGVSQNGPVSARILVVDDEPEIREMVGEFLRRRGYDINTAAGADEALAAVSRQSPDLMLLDLYMPVTNGIKLLKQLREAGKTVNVIMLTACQDEHLLKTTLDLGACEVLTKPVDLNQLELAVAAKLCA